MQLIAAAGSGKTEVVSQRVAHLLATSVPPEAIVAFTFTERAADELKNRISARVQDRLGSPALDLLSRLFVGTIHSYSFRVLQQHVPQYETYDVLDDNQLTAFLAREANRLRLRDLDPKHRLFASISAFLKNLAVVENELLPLSKLDEPFAGILTNYLETLDRYRLLTFGQQIALAVDALQRASVRDEVCANLCYLIVDEYQDVNPAQERLIELLAQPPVELCVVGDDDQAIYQWRGADVSNIVGFQERYPDVTPFTITKNRRSRPTIIKRANVFGAEIPDRLPKPPMSTYRPKGDYPEVVTWSADTEAEEAEWIAQLVGDLHGRGVPYRDVAVLVRTSAAYKELMSEFAVFNIPVQPGGRTGLFDQPEAIALGKAVVWLTDLQWRTQPFEQGVAITDKELFHDFARAFDLDRAAKARVATVLRKWKAEVPKTSRTADLVGEYYRLLAELNVSHWDLRSRIQVNRVGTLARFSTLLADYESVRRRSRPDARVAGEQVGGQDRGEHYYRNLGLHIINYAAGHYEGFDGEPDFELDAVDLTTVHRAKGLEWPVVFVPSLTNRRFPSYHAGQRQKWLIRRTAFHAARYEGSDADERRLFYVAMTRARDWLSLSRHVHVIKNSIAPSPYWVAHQALEVEPDQIDLPSSATVATANDDPVTVTYSDMALFLDCARAYRLRSLIGFQPRLAPELGYGKAVHHVLRNVADLTKKTGHVPNPDEIEHILESDFFLPSANKAAYREMKKAARRLITKYTTDHADDLSRVWETERPFELHLDGVNVSGRADVILDKEGGVETALAIVDYKTSTDALADNGLQLQVYSDAGIRENLNVRGAYMHDLQNAERTSIPIDPASIAAAEQKVSEAAARIRARNFAPNPGKRCQTCEVRAICGAARRAK